MKLQEADNDEEFNMSVQEPVLPVRNKAVFSEGLRLFPGTRVAMEDPPSTDTVQLSQTLPHYVQDYVVRHYQKKKSMVICKTKFEFIGSLIIVKCISAI